MPEISKDQKDQKAAGDQRQEQRTDTPSRSGSAQNLPRDDNQRTVPRRNVDTRTDEERAAAEAAGAEEGKAAERGRREQARLSAAKVGNEPYRAVHGDQPPPPEGPIGPLSGPAVDVGADPDAGEREDMEEMMEINSPRAFTMMLGPHEIGPSGQTALPITAGRNRIPARLADHVVLKRHGIVVDKNVRERAASRRREDEERRSQQAQQQRRD
jgi:hypothetical protein